MFYNFLLPSLSVPSTPEHLHEQGFGRVGCPPARISDRRLYRPCSETIRRGCAAVDAVRPVSGNLNLSSAERQRSAKTLCSVILCFYVVPTFHRLMPAMKVPRTCLRTHIYRRRTLGGFAHCRQKDVFSSTFDALRPRTAMFCPVSVGGDRGLHGFLVLFDSQNLLPASAETARESRAASHPSTAGRASALSVELTLDHVLRIRFL